MTCTHSQWESASAPQLLCRIGGRLEELGSGRRFPLGGPCCGSEHGRGGCTRTSSKKYRATIGRRIAREHAFPARACFFVISLRQMPLLGDDHLIDHLPSLVVEHESGRFVHDFPPSFAALLLARSMLCVLFLLQASLLVARFNLIAVRYTNLWGGQRRAPLLSTRVTNLARRAHAESTRDRTAWAR